MVLTIAANASLLIDGVEVGESVECTVTVEHSRDALGQQDILLSLDRSLAFDAEAAGDVAVRLSERDGGMNWLFDLLPDRTIRVNSEWIQDDNARVRLAFRFGAS